MAQITEWQIFILFNIFIMENIGSSAILAHKIVNLIKAHNFKLSDPIESLIKYFDSTGWWPHQSTWLRNITPIGGIKLGIHASINKTKSIDKITLIKIWIFWLVQIKESTECILYSRSILFARHFDSRREWSIEIYYELLNAATTCSNY